MFLSRIDIERLTGYRRPTRQISWLRRNGLRFFIGADGYPRVPQANFENPTRQRFAEPDFNSLKDMR